MSSTRIALPTLIFILLAMPAPLAAQDATGSIRGTVVDSTGSRISQASIAILNIATGLRYTATSDAEGGFAFELLPPGDYSARVVAEGMSPQVTPQLHVDVGGSANLGYRLTIAGAQEKVTGGAVVNVVTKSGSNHVHGTVFYHLRDSSFGAADAFLAFKPHNRQQQFGGTIGGPLKRNKIFFFGGFDQHIFHSPNVVEFLDGSSQVVPAAGTGPYTPGDYEASDQALVFAAAAHLTSLAGQYPAAQIGYSSYAKLDINLTSRNQLALRLSTMRYWGSNNVFLDSSSPVTYDSISNNGQELVSAETGSLSLTSALSPRWISHLRAQFSRDRQQSYSNTSEVLVKIPNILDGMGRSNLLPRQTREHRLHLAETVSLEGARNTWKFGGDGLFTWIYDFFPSQQSGEYLFYPIKVNPFTFVPMQSGLPLSPLRAYAHEVPHYYLRISVAPPRIPTATTTRPSPKTPSASPTILR